LRAGAKEVVDQGYAYGTTVESGGVLQVEFEAAIGTIVNSGGTFVLFYGAGEITSAMSRREFFSASSLPPRTPRPRKRKTEGLI
jgi:autotransporter passenger strand-loop-strand repeat protein